MEIQGVIVFQHNSVPRHKAKIVPKRLHKKHLKALDWLGNLPDLNPTENLWGILKQNVSKTDPASLEKLKTVLKMTWCRDIDENMCKNLSNSMPQRLLEIIRNKGYHTKY